MFLNASPIIFEHARSLRARETAAERILWSRLSKNQLSVKFRRQHPIHSYVLDFYCHKYRLGIEVDGNIHDLPEVHSSDRIRTETLASFGIKVIRFSNLEVQNNTNEVIEEIKKA